MIFDEGVRSTDLLLLYRIGGRVVLPIGIVQPVIYDHIGHGSLGRNEGSNGGLSYNYGSAVDLILLLMVTFGFHAAYNGLRDPSRNGA